MPLTILILAFVIPAAWLLDFLLGEPGNRKLKDRLTDFYVVVSGGDWSALYKYPASVLLKFMVHIIGPNPLTLRYATRTAVLSASMTAFLFMSSITWSYVYSALTDRHCPIPPLSQFFEIPGYMSSFLFYIFMFNIAFDYVSWSSSQLFLNLIVRSEPKTSLIIVVASPFLMFAMLYCLYAIYLPLAIMVQVRHQTGGQLAFQDLVAITRHNLVTLLDFISFPRGLFVLSCGKTDHTIFSISYFNTMQILAAETLIPFVLLLVSCVFGIFAYTTKPLTQKPLAFLIQRMDSSGQRIVILLAGFLSGISLLLAAIVRFLKG